MKAKKKIKSGSVKVDPTVYEKAAKHCETKGLKISFFATQALSEKLEKEENGLIK